MSIFDEKLLVEKRRENGMTSDAEASDVEITELQPPVLRDDEIRLRIRDALRELPDAFRAAGTKAAEAEVQKAFRNARVPVWTITPEGYSGYAAYHQETIFVDAIAIDAEGRLYIRHRVRKGLFRSKDVYIEGGMRPGQVEQELLACMKKDPDVAEKLYTDGAAAGVREYFAKYL